MFMLMYEKDVVWDKFCALCSVVDEFQLFPVARGWSALARSGRPLFTVKGRRLRSRDVHSSPWGVSARATPTAMPTPTYEKDAARDKSRAPRSVVDEFQLLPVARGWSALARSGRPLFTVGGQRSRSRDQDVHSSPWGVSACATPTAMPTPTYEKDPARDKSRAPRSVVDGPPAVGRVPRFGRRCARVARAAAALAEMPANPAFRAREVGPAHSCRRPAASHSAQQGHHPEERSVLGRSEVEDVDHVGVADARGQLRLASKCSRSS